MKKRMKQFMSLFLAVSMVFSMSLAPVHAAPVDEVVSEQSEIMESTVTEDEGEALPEEEKQAEETQEEKQEKQTETTQEEKETAEVEVEEIEEVEETQPQTTTTEEKSAAYTVNTENIDVSGVTPYSISVEDEVEVDETNPITATIEEELGEIKVLDEEGQSVALTKEQIQQILYVWQQYQDQCKANANLLGVQQPFFLSYNDKNEDGLGVLGEMLVLAGYTVDDVRSGKYSFDELMGMIQNFLYADKFAVKLYGDAIAAKRDEALKEVENSGAKTMPQKLLVLNDWIAHQATFDMAYIMKGDTDGDGKQNDPLMVAENPQKHKYYDTIYDEMYKLYEDQLTQKFHDEIYNGIVADLRQQYYEGAIKNIVKQNCMDQGMSEEDADVQAQAYMDANAEAIKNDAAGFVESEFGPEAAAQLSAGADDFIKDAEENGVEVDPENAPGYKMTVEELTQQTMANEKIVDLDGDGENDTTANDAIPIYAQGAADGLTQGILGAWEGNHVGILAEGKGVCAGYSKALSYLLQYMSPEYYAIDGATDMSVSSNWKTPEDLYYDEDGNLDINKDYIVDMVRITFNAETSMFGETGMFGEVHFWNAVKINKQWYYVDPCYTDIYVECMSRDRVEIDGTMNHMYFLFSDDTARELYDGNMKEIAGLYQGVATDKSYEDSWFARISSNAYSDGKNFYYLYDSTDQLSMMREFNNMNSNNTNKEDWEALMEGSDPDYKIVYHEMTDTDKSGGADSDFTTLINFNPKDDDDNTLSATVYNPANGEMEENELLTYLFAKYKEECDIYPSIKLTTALYNGKLYFNLSNCILSYELSTGNVSIVKEYDKVSGKRDNTNPFGGMAFTTCSESEADFTFTNRPIAAMTIKEDGKMYVSVATNLGFISGKETVNDISNYGYEYEESNYNPDYSNYTQDSDYSDEQLEQMGFSKETNDNDEFMWSAVFVDTISMSGMCTDHNYESVTETFCGRDGYTENRCTKCGAVEDGSRVVNEGTSCEHHYLHFEEQYYTKKNNAWNTGDCYVCTVCGFSIEEPEEPTKNSQESDEEFEERQAEYEKEKAIYDHAVEIAGHTYEAEENVEWSEDNSTATVSGEAKCTVCENKKLDVLGANKYDPKAEANADNSVLSVTLENPVELTVSEGSKTVTGTCDTNLTIHYVAKGTTEDGKKIIAKKTVTKESGRHDYEVTWNWKSAEETAEVPYTATADIKCSICGDEEKGLEATVALDEEKSVAATCEEAGKNVYKATASYTKTEGEDPYTFETTEDNSKVDPIDPKGHSYGEPEFKWNEENLEECEAVFTCTRACGEKEETHTEKCTVTFETKDPVCTEGGTITYTATCELNGSTYSDVRIETVSPMGHKYTELDKTWAADHSSCTFTFTCSRCGNKETKVDNAPKAATVKATCEENGKTTYTATCMFEEKTYSAEDTVVLPATGHDIKSVKPVFKWSSDNTSCTADYKCKVCEKTITKECKVTINQKDATYQAAGSIVYTATCGTDSDTKSTTLNQLDSEAKLNASSYAVYSTQRITSQITSKDSDDKIVSVQSSDPKKLAVTASGKKIAFKAAKVTKTTKVKVTATTASGKQLTATVTIKPTKVTLTATSVPLQLKKSTTAVKIKSKTYSADKVAKWSTSNKKFATVSSSGKITAKKTGTVTITLTMASGATAKCKVKVQKSAVKITKLSISKSKVTLKLKGGAKTYQIKTAKTPITVTSKVTYTSSNKKVATVSSSGKITAKKAGKATITVKCSGKSRKIAVTVKSK